MSKPLKILSARIKVVRSQTVGWYELAGLHNNELGGMLYETLVHRTFRKTICPVGKTATVKLTLEVEAIE